jgi:hypothetical protein
MENIIQNAMSPERILGASLRTARLRGAKSKLSDNS